MDLRLRFGGRIFMFIFASKTPVALLRPLFF